MKTLFFLSFVHVMLLDDMIYFHRFIGTFLLDQIKAQASVLSLTTVHLPSPFASPNNSFSLG